MSLLIFTLSPTCANVFTDTLAYGETNEPQNYVSKVTILPHLHMVMALTGVAQVGHRWAARLQSRMRLLDIDMCDQHAPGALRESEAEVKAEDGPLPMTSTAYHFGRSRESGEIVGYVYRSERDFTSERLQSGVVAAKPPPLDGNFGPLMSRDDYIELAMRIRSEQERRPAAERLGIGGDLILTAVTPEQIIVETAARFPDFDVQWEQMNARRQQGTDGVV